MNIRTKEYGRWLAGLTLLLVSIIGARVEAQIDGVTGTTFNFTAKPAIITTPDGDSLLVWGYGLDGEPMQYPGPTLIVNQGDFITITLKNELDVPNMPVSLLFPGQEGVMVTGGSLSNSGKPSPSTGRGSRQKPILSPTGPSGSATCSTNGRLLSTHPKEKSK